MKKRIKIIMVILAVLICYCTITTQNPIVRAKSKDITIKEYLELLIDIICLPGEKTNDNSCTEIALAKGLLLKEDEFALSKQMTRSECAVLTNRTDIFLNGSTETKVFDEIREHNRISDLDEITDEYQEDVVQVFGKGILIGYSNGKYTQSRAFKGNNKITYNGAKDIVKRIKNKKLRKIMSPDGQLTRTTKLPCNASEYEYILASFPNKFYEMKFRYEYLMGNHKMRLYKDYTKPVDMKNEPFINSSYKGTAEDTRKMLNKYLDIWNDMVRTNLECRFNVDYRTIDKKWCKKIKTSYINDENKEDDSLIQDSLNSYIEDMKKNKVIIKSKLISVEPSTLYSFNGYYLRCYIKFKVISAVDMKGVLIYENNNNVAFKNLKKNVWHEGYYDIALSNYYGNSFGEDILVRGEEINDYLMDFKNHILKQKFNNKGSIYAPEGYYYWD